MERKWLELPTMGEAFCISKRPFIITRSAYAGHSVIRLLGRVIMLPLDIYVANIQVQKNVNFWNGLYWF
jgi:hypothetical protein